MGKEVVESMERFEGVANTLFVPLTARISISKEFPEYFVDKKALELEQYLPDDAAKGSSQYTNMASVARYYNMDQMVSAFAGAHERCNVVYLGAGLETAYDRLSSRLSGVFWYEVDLPEVIEARRKVFGTREREVTIPGDMFDMGWAREVDASLPTLLVVSGVFQYFHEEQVTDFIRSCGKVFPEAEIIFDATSTSGLRFTNWFIKRTGNANALMYFGVDDAGAFATKCGAGLLEERTFFPDALRMLGKRLGLVTRVSMRVAESKRQVLILRLKLPA